ncbi:MAG TPA: hypothetical protein VIZ28_19980 [Chitinophagaceae bacterium]
MHVSFIKIVHFTRLIKAGGRLREFNFRKLRTTDPEIFTVDTVDDRGNRILFRMQKNGTNQWGVMPQVLPRWVPENEIKLHEAIEDELHNPS